MADAAGQPLAEAGSGAEQTRDSDAEETALEPRRLVCAFIPDGMQ